MLILTVSTILHCLDRNAHPITKSIKLYEKYDVKKFNILFKYRCGTNSSHYLPYLSSVLIIMVKW